MRASVEAHGWPANSSGKPVSAQPTNDNIRNACMMRSVREKRR